MPKLRGRISPKVKPKSWKWWRNKLDEAMGKLVREKKRCEWCGSVTNQMHWAHVIGRTNKTLRWDIFNGMCLCAYCHEWRWHQSPLEAVEWFKSKYPERYDYLMEAKNIVWDWTEDDYRIRLEAIQNKQFDLLHLDLEV